MIILFDSSTVIVVMPPSFIDLFLSGITKYDKSGTSSDDYMTENISKPARLILDSTYGNINIYNTIS